jgi:Na+:H+ antiporter, NhaA family
MAGSERSRIIPSRLIDFLRTEEASGALLLAASVVALVWANSPLAASYERLWSTVVSIGAGGLSITKDLQHWVNDGLMTLFFLVVGLEIKREITTGELRDPRTLALPVVAAVGGMVVPAAIFLALNAGQETATGWGIPVATDIAFALGILTLVAATAPVSVRSFLLTLAIVDDIGAVILIAVFYSGGIDVGPLLVGVAMVGLVLALRLARVRRVAPYVVVGIGLWLAFDQAGIHPTIAGVVLGLMTPSVALPRSRFGPARDRVRRAAPANDERWDLAPLDRVESALHPWTSRLVVPVFALANAGVALNSSLIAEAVTSALGAGVFLGLVVGKPLGITLAVWVAIRLGLGQLPDDFRPSMVLGAAALAGVGFTVSLFVADLAFEQPNVDVAKLAVLAASIVASLLGVLILRRAVNQR